MKTKNLFFIVALLFIGVFKTFGQTTYSAPSNAATLGSNNTNVGTNAGSNSNLSFPNQNNYNNVYVGSNSGNSNANSALNTCVGTNSGGRFASSLQPIGSYNCFFGASSGFVNDSGNNNVGIGFESLKSNTSGAFNVSIGVGSLFKNTISGFNIGIGPNALNSFNSLIGTTQNIGIGHSAGSGFTDGIQNIFFGMLAGSSLKTGNTNIIIGSQAGGVNNTNSGDNNIYMGTNVAYTMTSGSYNTLLGFQSGNGLQTGNRNTFLGYVGIPNTLATATSAGSNTNNTIILADNDPIFPKQRLYIHGGETLAANLFKNGNTGIGLDNNVIPQNRLEVKSGFVNNASTSSGLRLTNLKNTIAPIVNPSLLVDKAVLSVDVNGDVILVKDIGGSGISQNCSTSKFIPVNSATVGVLACSQIYDNGTNVGVGLTNPSLNNWNYTSLSTVGITTTPATGAVKFDVNGVIRSTAYLATSDKKFKRDIKSIDNALKTIESINGKTYLWDREANKEMNFDGGGHSGFIAQELEKVLPHLVATGQNGDKAVNYMELLPYLVEAIKEQQTQIKEQQAQIDVLNNQVRTNFRAKHQDLIELQNTKIISISPNPSNDIITISLNIDKTVQNAVLQVYDLNGKIMNSLAINDRDNNITKTLQKDNFGQGVYIVSLIVNGKSVDSKKIIFN